MEKKQLQEQRMKGYFIQATKELLKGEGLRSISVRNIADRAGYSYATLYNYFQDVKDLIFYCVKDFQDECDAWVKNETGNSTRGIPKIRGVIISYIRYFIQYPGIFELFFLERITDLSHRQPTLEIIYTLLDRLTADEWEHCINRKLYTAQEAEIRKEQTKFLVSGLLLFYLNRRQPATYRDFMELTERHLDHILTKP